ncbi:MAG: helicase-related protein [Candidatus Tyrphobacter sp.]
MRGGADARPSTPAPSQGSGACARDDRADDDVRRFVDDAFAHKSEYLDDRYSTIGDASAFHSKIVGVSFEGRQDTIAGLRDGASLELVRQPDNPSDANAIAVFYGALQLGYLRKEIAKHLAPNIDGGARYRARIASLTGQGGPDKHRGVNIFVERDAATIVKERSARSGELRAAARDDDDAVRAALIGDAQPHEYQRAVLERIERGQRTLALFGTGRGKSFCFQYPAVTRALAAGHKTLAIYPLRALANDQYDSLARRLDPFGLRIFRANGSIAADERADLFAALDSGEWDVILSTPEFLSFHRNAFAGASAPALVVVDEAHHLYESRHRPAYARLGETIAALGGPQVVALTATAGEAAFERIVKDLRVDAWVIDPTVRENLHLVDARGKRDKLAYLEETLRSGEKAIVYCNSRSEAAKVAQQLRAALVRDQSEVMFYHARMPGAMRREVERLFRAGSLRVVVATSAFGEGIDLPDVRHVVLYHLNFSFTEFNQQAGRAGRDGAAAFVHLLYGEQDRRINEFIIDRSAPTLSLLRRLYAEMKALRSGGVLAGSASEIAARLDMDKVSEETVRAAAAMFADVGLVRRREGEEGHLIEFVTPDGKVDMTRNERFAEGEAERESFQRFAELALSARIEDLERLVNRPIYPSIDRVR